MATIFWPQMWQYGKWRICVWKLVSYTCRCYHWRGVCVQECIQILYAYGVLVFLVGSASVWSEKVFICENNNFLQQKCMRVPIKSMWSIGWLLIFISDSCTLGYRHSEVEVCQLLICLAVTILCWFTKTCH